jgi:hypothetical protein
MSRILAIVGCALLASVTSLEAQDSSAILARMEVRLDSLRHLAVAGDSTTDTVIAGGIRIATSAALRPFVAPAAAKAWRGVLLRFGPDVAAQHPLPVQQFGGTQTIIPRHLDGQELAVAFEAAATRAIWGQQDTLLVRWLAGNYPITPMSPQSREDLLEELVRMPATSNPACLAGSAAACASVLGLRPRTDVLSEWYPTTAWPRLARLADRPRSPGDDRCYVQQEPDACRAILLSGRIPPPVGMAGRQYLLQLTLESGGPGAFGRLAAGSGASIEQRLAAAAGVSVDSLLGAWAAAVRASAPERPAPTAWLTLLVLGWCALVLAMSMAEGRWR